jgi:hypothetical protein
MHCDFFFLCAYNVWVISPPFPLPLWLLSYCSNSLQILSENKLANCSQTVNGKAFVLQSSYRFSHKVVLAMRFSERYSSSDSDGCVLKGWNISNLYHQLTCCCDLISSGKSWRLPEATQHLAGLEVVFLRNSDGKLLLFLSLMLYLQYSLVDFYPSTLWCQADDKRLVSLKLDADPMGHW